MTAYNFQQQFVPLIQKGIKRSTIRAARRHGNPQPGKRLQLYHGMRTRQCKRIIDDPLCTNVRPITIDIDGGIVQVVLDNRKLYRDEVLDLARGDGFETVKAFTDFFARVYQLPANLWLIEWQP